MHRRPSASRLTAVSTLSSRSPEPTAIHPVRHPGATYAFEADEKEMTGASGFRALIGGTGPSYTRSVYASSDSSTMLCRSASSSSASLVFSA